MTDWSLIFKKVKEQLSSIAPRVISIKTWRCGKPLDDEWLVKIAHVSSEDFDLVSGIARENKVNANQIFAEIVGADETLPTGEKPHRAISPLPEGFKFLHYGKYLLSSSTVLRLGIPKAEDVTERVAEIWRSIPAGISERVVHLTNDRLYVGSRLVRQPVEEFYVRRGRMDGRPPGAHRLEVDDWDFEVPLPVTLRWDPWVIEDGIQLIPKINIPSSEHRIKTLEMLGLEPKIISREGFHVFLLDDYPTVIIDGEL